MSRALSALIALWLVSLGACVRRFEEARPDEPHAIVKVRIVHHAQPGPQLAQSVRWSGYDVRVAEPAPSPSGPARETLRVVRMRPELGEWSFSTEYFHTVTRTRMETRYRSESYSCGTETAGFGRNTYQRTRTCTRQVPYQQLVTHTDRITDGGCTSGSTHRPLAYGIYLMQFDYYGEDRCTLQCFRQIPAADGTFTLLPCGAGEPPGDRGVMISGAEAAPPPPSYTR